MATLAPAPKSSREADTVEAEELDLTVQEVTFDYLATRNLDPETEGVVVRKPPVAVRTNPNRVRRGDLLVKLGDQTIADLAAFREAVVRLGDKLPTLARVGLHGTGMPGLGDELSEPEAVRIQRYRETRTD